MSLPIYHVPQRSKWDILQERLAKAREAVEYLEREVRYLENTPFITNGHGHCSNCGERFVTEKDFAQHYLVTDERFLNIGECPNPKKEW